MMSQSTPLTVSRIATTIALASSAVWFTACSPKESADTAAVSSASAASADAVLSSDEQKVSYAIGYNIGRDMASQPGLAIDQGALSSGLIDALNQTEPQLTEEQIQAAFVAVQQKMMARMAEEGEANLKVGQAFLEENKQRPEVSVTDSGLQYEVIESGAGGPKPKAEDTVRVHYHGTLIDGSVFDSSVQRGEPVEFPLFQVIPGWTEALQMMSVGDKWKLYVPANLGYGASPRPKIPSQSTLIFEVELLGINPAAAETPETAAAVGEAAPAE